MPSRRPMVQAPGRALQGCGAAGFYMRDDHGSTVLTLRECTDGWRVFKGQQQLCWLQDYDEALTTTLTVAAVHVDIREVPALVELQMSGEQPVHVTTLSPTARAG